MAHELTTSYLRDSLGLFQYYKKLAERSMEQVSDEQLFAVLDSEMNSIGVTVKHLAGNMRSRWTDFLNSDGEKPDRKRDSEFEDPPETRAALMKLWEEGWSHVFAALEPLSDADLERTVQIRGEPHSVMQAINRQIAHSPIIAARLYSWQNICRQRDGSRSVSREVGRKNLTREFLPGRSASVKCGAGTQTSA